MSLLQQKQNSKYPQSSSLSISPTHIKSLDNTKKNEPIKILWESKSYNRSSVNLHQYTPPEKSYAEVKCGGHPYDYKRMLDDRISQKTYRPNTPAKTLNLKFLWARSNSYQGHTYQKKMWDIRDGYNVTKVGGHPLDHVPFVGRGKPSRLLLMFNQENSEKFEKDSSHISSNHSRYNPAIVPPLPSLYFPVLAQMHSVCIQCCSGYYTQPSERPIVLYCQHLCCRKCLPKLNRTESWGLSFVECTLCCQWVPFFQNQLSPRSNKQVRFQSANVSTHTNTPLNQMNNHQWSLVSHIQLAVGYTSVSHMIYPLLKKMWTYFYPEKQKNNNEQDKEEINIYNEKYPRISLCSIPNDQMSDVDAWKHRMRFVKSSSKLHRYSFIRSLGKGSFAEVLLMKRGKRLCVLKESDKLEESVNEISLLQRIKSEYVVQVQDFFLEQVGHRKLAYIQLEYCDAGDLEHFIKQKGNMNQYSLVKILNQICLALRDIHSCNIVHRDLKPGNILLMKNFQLKLADFGVSTRLESTLATHHAAGTLAFMAPEIRKYFMGEAVRYDTRADIWSLGALAIAMITGNLEPSINRRPISETIQNLEQYHLEETIIKAIEQSLDPDPVHRISLDSLIACFDKYLRIQEVKDKNHPISRL